VKLAAVATCAVLAACDRGPTLTSCQDSLSGLWQDPQGRSWAILDQGARVEVYPSFPDNELPPGADAGLEVAPRVIDLQRAGEHLSGVVHRRFMREDKPCDSAIRIRVVACRARSIELELAEPPAPTSFAPCAFPAVAPPTVSRWTWAAVLR
jgi:hypothetical protein